MSVDCVSTPILRIEQVLCNISNMFPKLDNRRSVTIGHFPQEDTVDIEFGLCLNIESWVSSCKLA